jgi:hypothetical protein
MRPTVGQNAQDELAELGQIPDVPFAKLVGRNSVPLRDQAQQKVLRADVAVAQTVRFGNAELDRAFGVVAEPDQPPIIGAPWLQTVQNRGSHFVELHAMVYQHVCSYAAALEQQAQK